jgi:hypothetical protein
VYFVQRNQYPLAQVARIVTISLGRHDDFVALDSGARQPSAFVALEFRQIDGIRLASRGQLAVVLP